MADSIQNIAVIALPRTGSRSLVKKLANELGKEPALGILHKPEYIESEWDHDLRETVFGHQHVIHGHWHTIEELDIDIQSEIRNNYKIVDIIRHPWTTFLSMQKLIHETQPDVDVGPIFSDTFHITQCTKLRWPIYKTYIFEDEYGRR
tara:strand:+ start:1170 stop:1613 length:444 start_codon:yes stop_codon:yes gene_type:complete